MSVQVVSANVIFVTIFVSFFVTENSILCNSNCQFMFQLMSKLKTFYITVNVSSSFSKCNFCYSFLSVYVTVIVTLCYSNCQIMSQ